MDGVLELIKGKGRDQKEFISFCLWLKICGWCPGLLRPALPSLPRWYFRTRNQNKRPILKLSFVRNFVTTEKKSSLYKWILLQHLLRAFSPTETLTLIQGDTFWTSDLRITKIIKPCYISPSLSHSLWQQQQVKDIFWISTTLIKNKKPRKGKDQGPENTEAWMKNNATLVEALLAEWSQCPVAEY